MTDSEILAQLIKPDAQVYVEYEYEKPFIKLVEPQQANKCTTIKNVPIDTIVIKADAFSAPKTVFIGNRGECKRADYIVISESKKCIIYIEMKSGADDTAKIKKQLHGAQCFLKYCQEIGKSFWGDRDFLSGYKSRFVSIKHIRIPKRPSRDNFPLHDTPEKLLPLAGCASIQFNNIAKINE